MSTLSIKGAINSLFTTLIMLPGLALVAVALVLSMMFLWNYECKLHAD
jgi:hypothetical protein